MSSKKTTEIKHAYSVLLASIPAALNENLTSTPSMPTDIQIIQNTAGCVWSTLRLFPRPFFSDGDGGVGGVIFYFIILPVLTVWVARLMPVYVFWIRFPTKTSQRKVCTLCVGPSVGICVTVYWFLDDHFKNVLIIFHVLIQPSDLTYFRFTQPTTILF